MKKHDYYVYTMSSNTGTLYLGITNNLERRVLEHKKKVIPGFSSKYNCNRLVYFEHSNDINSAIEREKQIKKWRREKKEFLINKMNPYWKDISLDWE